MRDKENPNRVTVDLTVTDLLTRGEGYELRANDGQDDNPERVAMAITNLDLPSLALWYKLRVTVEVIKTEKAPT